MTAIAIKKINKRLEIMPSNLYGDVLLYLDYLSFKNDKKSKNEPVFNELQNSFIQVKQMQEGKIAKQSIKSFLDEL